MKRTARWILAGSLLAATAFAQTHRDDDPNLGRRLYETGVGVDGEPVIAVLEAPGTSATNTTMPGVELPATALPCVGCHGKDGRGRPEGGVSPTDLRWHALTRPWRATAGNGRTHPPYDERLFVRAVTLGFDPAGTRLETAMPRYRLSQADAKALVAYMKELGRPEPGVDEDRLVVGVLRPESMDPAQKAALDVLEAWSELLSAGGGIYGRRLDLLSSDVPEGDLPGAGVVAWIALPGVEPRRSAKAGAPILLAEPCEPGCQARCPSCLVVPQTTAHAPSRRWLRLADGTSLPQDHLAEQLRALAAAEILTEALERTGRRVDADALWSALTDRGGFETSIGIVRLAALPRGAGS